MKRDKTAFSVAEVLICITIVGILAAFIVPTITTNIDKTKRLSIAQNTYGALCDLMSYLVKSDIVIGSDAVNALTLISSGSNAASAGKNYNSHSSFNVDTDGDGIKDHNSNFVDASGTQCTSIADTNCDDATTKNYIVPELVAKELFYANMKASDFSVSGSDYSFDLRNGARLFLQNFNLASCTDIPNELVKGAAVTKTFLSTQTSEGEGAPTISIQSVSEGGQNFQPCFTLTIDTNGTKGPNTIAQKNDKGAWESENSERFLLYVFKNAIVCKENVDITKLNKSDL